MVTRLQWCWTYTNTLAWTYSRHVLTEFMSGTPHKGPVKAPIASNQWFMLRDNMLIVAPFDSLTRYCI